MNIISKVNKKAWKEIQQIKNSTNMMDVERYIENAVLNACGTRNLGLMSMDGH